MRACILTLTFPKSFDITMVEGSNDEVEYPIMFKKKKSNQIKSNQIKC